MTLMSRVLIALLALNGAVAAANTEFKPGDAVSVESGDGLLAVNINAPPFTSLVRIGKVGSVLGGVTLTSLDQWRTIRLVQIPAGEYRWTRVDLLGGGGYLRVKDDPRYHFKVEPGVINYPGDLDVETVGSRFHIGVPNRAARFLAALDQHFPGARLKYPLHYVGMFPDRFVEFAAAELGSDSAYEALKAGSSRKVDEHATDADPALRAMIGELFARAEVSAAYMNPAGDTLATIEFRDGKHHVALIDAQSQRGVDVYRGDVVVRSIEWGGDRTLLMSIDNPNGASDYVVRLSSAPGAAPVFTQMPVPGRGWLVDPLPRDENHAIYARFDSDRDVHMYRVDLRGKSVDDKQFRRELRLDKGLKNAFFGLADGNGVLRVAMTVNEGDYALMYRGSETAPWVEFKRVGADARFDPVLLSEDGAGLIVKTDEGRNQVELVRIGLPSGAVEQTLFAEPGADVEGVIVSSFDRRVVAALAFRDGSLQTHYLERPDEQLREALHNALPDKAAAIFDTSSDRRHALLLAFDETDPGTYYYYDAVTKTAQKMFARNAPPSHVTLVRSKLIKAAAADGLAIEAYLTLPPSGPAPYPLIVVPHGGPIGVRDGLTYDPEVELLANRGYAVLRTNYRGSGGFGRAFEQAGFGAWGKSIEDDVLAALDAALRTGSVDRSRVAIRGASYGGYSVLMSLIRSPERFRCGIALSAVTDLPLMFTSSDWANDKKVRERMMRVVGDPAKALEEMQAVSPDYLYRKLDRPLLIAHGGRDARVAPEHMLRLSMLLGHAAHAPQTMYFPHEAHGVADVASRELLETAGDRFLAGCLAPSATAAATPR